MTSNSKKNKLKEYVSKWNASQNEVDANTKQQDELAEVEVDGKVDDLENVDDSENDEDEYDVEISKGFLVYVLCYDEFTEDELYEHCCNKDYYIQGKIIKKNYIQCNFSQSWKTHTHI